MNLEQHQQRLALMVANQNVNDLIRQLAAKCAEVDALKAQLSPPEDPKEKTKPKVG
jgi:hypothetical protein